MSNTSTVTIYSAPWCAFCHMAKSYFDSIKVPYKDIDVDADSAAASEMVEKTGQAGIPVIEIGDKTIIGFNKPAIEQVLKDQQII
jgi:glutaredoxin 3